MILSKERINRLNALDGRDLKDGKRRITDDLSFHKRNHGSQMAVGIAIGGWWEGGVRSEDFMYLYAPADTTPDARLPWFHLRNALAMNEGTPSGNGDGCELQRERIVICDGNPQQRNQDGGLSWTYGKKSS